MVMQEVTKQLGPLADRVSLLSNNIERLYNSNGGPPGYLQTARREDNERFEMIFKILEDLGPIKDFVRDHEAKEEATAADLATKVHNSEWRSNRNLALATLILGVLTLVRGCGAQIKAALFEVPQAHSQLQQNATIPNTR